MKAYVTQDGEIIEAASDAALIKALRETAMFPVATDEEYMRDVSKRVKASTGKAVRTGKADEFVADLLAAEVIKEYEAS